jgi:hypothetical protein
MQPNKMKQICIALLVGLFAFFAPNALFAQAKAAPQNQQARQEARQAMIAKKAALRTEDALINVDSPASEQKANTIATPLQVVSPIREEKGVSNPTEAVKPN